MQQEDRNLNRIDSGDEMVYGLIGKPLRHSFSPRYFSERFQKEGVPAGYHLFELESIDELLRLIASEPRLRGLNVTSPYKQEVLRYIDYPSPEALAVGAANVLHFDSCPSGEVKIYGYNTDIEGFRLSLSRWLQGALPRALVFGSGGAARAVERGLSLLGIEYQRVSRSPRAGGVSYDAVRRGLGYEFLLWINATPVGLHEGELLPLPYEVLGPGHFCFDLIYNPSPTTFLREAARRGAKTKDGLEMLHLQADEAWKIWTL